MAGHVDGVGESLHAYVGLPIRIIVGFMANAVVTCADSAPLFISVLLGFNPCVLLVHFRLANRTVDRRCHPQPLRYPDICHQAENDN